MRKPEKQKTFQTMYTFPPRFAPPADVWGTPAENPRNECYCADPEAGCDTPSGVFNLTKCQFKSPIYLSWPHFFQVCNCLAEDLFLNGHLLTVSFALLSGHPK